MLLVIIAIIIALYVAWNIGSNGLSNLIAPSVGSESLKMRTAMIYASLLAFAGALLLGDKVIQTISTKIVASAYVTPIGAISALFAAGLWMSLCTFARLPTSATHSIVGAIAGFGIITRAVVQWGTIKTIFLGWITSLFIGAFLAFATYSLIHTFLIMRINSIPERQAIEEKFKILQIAATGYIAFALGSNSIATVVGPLAMILPNNTLAMKIAGSVVIAIGAATLGPRIIRCIGNDIMELTPSRGFSAQFAAATVVLFFTALKVPVSPTQVLVTAIVGVGLARGIQTLNTGILRRILFSWVVTPPAAALLSMLIYKAAIITLLLLL